MSVLYKKSTLYGNVLLKDDGEAGAEVFPPPYEPSWGFS